MICTTLGRSELVCLGAANAVRNAFTSVVYVRGPLVPMFQISVRQHAFSRYPKIPILDMRRIEPSHIRSNLSGICRLLYQ
jgi:hypothetical protein